MRKTVTDQESYIHSNVQYTRRNRIEILGIPKTLKNDELESKAIDIFGAINNIFTKYVEDCHCPGKDGNYTTVRFVNREYCWGTE